MNVYITSRKATIGLWVLSAIIQSCTFTLLFYLLLRWMSSSIVTIDEIILSRLNIGPPLSDQATQFVQSDMLFYIAFLPALLTINVFTAIYCKWDDKCHKLRIKAIVNFVVAVLTGAAYFRLYEMLPLAVAISK